MCYLNHFHVYGPAELSVSVFQKVHGNAYYEKLHGF